MAIGASAAFLLFILVGPVLTVFALIDLLRRPATDWTNSGQDRLVWAIVVLLVGIIGPVLYLTLGRSKLNAAAAVWHPPVVGP